MNYLNYHHYYQNAHRIDESNVLNQSLAAYVSVLDQRIGLKGLEILELGCGKGAISSLLVSKGASVTAMDISEVAISNAVKCRANFVVGDVLELCVENKYDLVFDSHLFHCIIFDQERADLLKRIHLALRTEGYLALETMVWPGRLLLSDKYRVEDCGIVWQQELEGEFPCRRVRRSVEIEQELSASGFEIIYMWVDAFAKIIIDDNVLASNPDCVRIIVRKKE